MANHLRSSAALVWQVGFFKSPGMCFFYYLSFFFLVLNKARGMFKRKVGILGKKLEEKLS